MEGLTEDYDADLSKLQADLKDKQDEVQKKTFTKWINSYLSRHDPPSAVKDLFADLRDGVLLLNLLKELTGETLTIEKGDRFGNGQRIHHINNVRNALQLLQDKKIKMVNIHAGDIVDGRPSIILGLIWTLILHFQIEESTKIMCSKMFGDDDEKMSGWRKKSEPKVVMLKWAQKTITEKYGVEVKDFGASWRNGVAFHALIHDAKPHIVDMEAVVLCPPRENLERAFDTAERVLGIPRLLDPEDVDVEKPDEKSIMTYVSKFVQKFPQNLHSCEGSDTKEMIEKFTRKVKELDDWLSKNNEFASCGDVQSMQMEDLLISLNEFSSLLEDEHALCKYLHVEVRTLLEKVPHNFQVMALEKQVEQMKEQFVKLKEMIDFKIKNLQDVEIMLEKHEHDLIAFEKWKNYAMEFMNKLEKMIDDGEDVASPSDLDKWKDHVADNYHGIVLMNDLEALDKVKVLNPRNYEKLKRQILDSLMSFREIRDEAFDKFSTIEFKVEECKCEKLMSEIFTDMHEIEDRMKIGALSHEKALEVLNGVGISIAEVRILIDTLASICEKNLDVSLHQTVDKHQKKFQTLNDKLSMLTYKIKCGNSLYDDYLTRKSGIVAWIEKMEMQVHHLRVIYPESDEYEGILDDFKEMMNEIHDHMGSIQESKIILQELAFNSAWAAKIDEETKQFHDFTDRIENLNRMFEEVQRASSIAFICKDLKTSIKEKMKLVEESCFYGSCSATGQSCDDTQAIKMMLEEFERFESSVSEVEILMEEGYALLDDSDAYRCLATFLKEAFQFCCDSRNVAHERLDILKKSLELWANYESIRSKFITYSSYPSPSPSGDALCQQSKINQLKEVEHSLMELEELDVVIAELSKHISYEKHVELVEDCNKVREKLKKSVASLSGEIEAADLSAMFEHEMNGLRKFINSRKVGIISIDSNDEVDMERIVELMNQTKILIEELSTEGSSRIQCIAEFLRRIEENDFISEDMKAKYSSDFKSLERSFEEFCEEVDNLHRNTSSDAEHLMTCGRIVMETSEWIRSEQVHVGRFEDVEDAEMELRKAEELHSTLEYHETLMSDLESEGNLVSERNNINGLVCKLRHELEAFKVNLGACHVTLNGLIDNWREFIDLRNQIDSMKESIADQLVTCKASLNQFEACVVDGRLSATLKDVTMDVEKIIDSNNQLRSIIDKLEPHITEGCQKAMWSKVNENEWIYQSLRQEVNNQADNLCRITKEFEMFAGEVDDCLCQIENLYQEIEDVTKDLKDIVTCQKTSARVKEIFSSQLESISLFWDHIKEKKEFFSKEVESPLHEKLMRIDSCIGDISELNVHLITICSSYGDYFKMIKKAEMNLIEFEDNLMDCGKAVHFKELYDLLDEIKLMEETMKDEVIHLNGIDGKSCDDSLEWLSQSIPLMEKFHVIKSMHKNLSDVELRFKTIESMIAKLYESFNCKEIIDSSDVMTMKSIINAMEDESKERLNEIETNMKDLDEFMTSENNLIKLYERRYEKMKDSLDELCDNFESQRIKRGCLVEKLQTTSELLMKADKYSHFDATKLSSIDDVETKLTSLQECHYELSNFKMSLEAAIQDVNNFSKDKDLKMFSKFLSAYLSDLSKCEEKLNIADAKLLKDIENLNILKLRYKEFIEEVTVLDREISNMIDTFKDILLGTISPIGVNFQKYQEDISSLRVKVNYMEKKPEWNIIMEDCSQGSDLITSEKNQFLGNLAEAQELIGCLVCRVDQCQERTEIVKCQVSTLKEQIKILADSLLCINDDNDDDYDRKLAKVEEYLKLVEEYGRQIDSLQWRSAVLVEEFKTFASDDVLLDLNSLVEEIDSIKRKLNDLQQTFRTKKELAKILNKFKNFMAQIDGMMDSMKTENVRNINKALQRVNDLIIEGEQIEQEIIKSSSALSSSSDGSSKIIQKWNDKKQELEMLRQFYEDELIRSQSLKMRLSDFKSWMENMLNLHSKISSETYFQSEVVQQFKDFELNLKDNEIHVENLSNLMNSASNFDENKILIEEGEVLILKYSQLREKVNFWIRKSTRSLENVEKFQKEEQKVKDLLNSMKKKISKDDSVERFEDQLTKLIDIDMDLDVVQIIMDKMDEGMDYKEMSEDEKEGIQSCMESIKIDLLQISESKEKLESNLKEQSDLFRECKNKMEDLKEWIDDKECLMSNLKSDDNDGGTIDEELDEEMTMKMRCMEELKEKMESLNHDDAKVEMSKYSSDLNSLKMNFMELSAMLKDRTDNENEYFIGLDAIIKCAGAMVDVFGEGEHKDHKDHLKINDENVSELMSKLKGCLNEVKLVLSINNGGKEDVEHSKDHQLSRIHGRDEMEKLVEYLDDWISFQDAFEKFHNGLKSNGKDDSKDSCIILGSYKTIQNLHNNHTTTTTTSEDRQHQIINNLTTVAENLKPVAMTTWCHRTKELWDDVYKAAKKLVTCLTRWTSKVEDIDRSLKKYNALQLKVSEFVNINDGGPIEANDGSLIQFHEKVKNFDDMEEDLAGMMKAAFDLMTFVGHEGEKVKLEKEVVNMKEEFERCKIASDVKSIKLNSSGSEDCFDVVDGNTILEQHELLELANTSMIQQDTTSPDEGYKTFICDASLHDILSVDQSYKSSESLLDQSRESLDSPIDQSCEGLESPNDTEEANMVVCKREINEGLNHFIQFFENLKTSHQFSNHPNTNGISMIPYDERQSIIPKDTISRDNNNEGGDDDDDNTPSSLIHYSPQINIDTSSISSRYSNFLLFLSSCFECFSFQPKLFYQQLEEMNHLEVTTRNLEYFHIILPMKIVFKLKKIADWFDPALQNLLTNEDLISRLRCYLAEIFMFRSKDRKWNRRNVLFNDAVLSQKLSKQRKELDIIAKDQNNYISLIKKFNESFQELSNCVNQVQPSNNAIGLKDHMTTMEKSLKKSKLNLETLRNSSSIYSKREGLCQNLLKLLDAKLEEASCEVEDQRRKIEEKEDSTRRLEGDLEALTFKINNHRKWFDETNLMDLTVENDDIFKCVEHETRNRIRNISKAKISLELMIENEKWILKSRCSNKINLKLSCNHIDEESIIPSMWQLLISGETSNDDDIERLSSDVDHLLDDAFQFRKKLRKCKVERSTKNLIDVDHLDEFNQLETAWKNHKDDETKLDNPVDVSSSSSSSSSSSPDQYKDALERMAVLKLSINSIDISRRKLSSLNVQAYLKKFAVIKQELIELLPALKKLRTSQPIDRQSDITIIDLDCFWRVLADKIINQIDLIRMFIEHANLTNLKIENYKSDVMLYESHSGDIEGCSVLSHYKHCEEVRSLIDELRREVMITIVEFQKHPTWWNFQNFQIETLAILSRVEKLSSELDLKKVKAAEKMERWKKFVEESNLNFMKLNSLDGMLRMPCGKCQVEDIIRLLRTRYSRELHETNNNIKELECEGMKMSSDDVTTSSFVRCKINLLKNLQEACTRKCSSRLKKLQQVSDMIMKFEASLTDFKRWTTSKEKELTSSFKFKQFSFQDILRTIETLRVTSQDDLKQHGRDVSILVGVCEVLCFDSDSCPSPLERDAVMATKTLLDGKWIDIIDLSIGRKSILEEVWRHWKKYRSDCKIVKDLLESIKIDLDRHHNFGNFESLNIPGMRRASHFYKELISRMDGECWRRNEVKEDFRQMALNLWVDQADEMHAMLERLWREWQDTEHSIRLAGRRIGYHLDLFKMFQSSAVSLHQWLVGISTSLEQVERSFEVDAEFNCKKNFKLIKKMKREVRQKLEEFNEVAKSLDVIIDDDKKEDDDDDDDDDGGGGGDDNSSGAFQQGAKEVMNNFSKFQSDILQRIKIMERKMNLDILEKVDICTNRGSNVDEIESQLPISSHLDKNLKKPAKSRDAPQNVSWSRKVTSVAHTQLLLLILVTSACLLPLSKVQPDDLIGSLSRL